MMQIIRNGGLGNVGTNFDAKTRRNSTDLEDGKLSLEQLAEIGRKVDEPVQTSGKQELYEAIINMYAIVS